MARLETTQIGEGGNPGEDPLKVTDVGAYVLDLVRGMRRMTRTIDQQDVRFLDYLLAITEDQAAKIAENSYH